MDWGCCAVLCGALGLFLKKENETLQKRPILAPLWTSQAAPFYTGSIIDFYAIS